MWVWVSNVGEMAKIRAVSPSQSCTLTLAPASISAFTTFGLGFDYPSGVMQSSNSFLIYDNPFTSKTSMRALTAGRLPCFTAQYIGAVNVLL